MIRFGFSISWPFRWKVKQQDFVLFSKQLFKNKAFELQISRFDPDELIDFTLDLNWRGHDHAGPRFELSILGWFFSLKLYDTRHWNYDKNRWETYND
jgi:hypothetical protein